MPLRRTRYLPALALEIAFRLLLAGATLCSLSWLSGCFGGASVGPREQGNVALSAYIASSSLSYSFQIAVH